MQSFSRRVVAFWLAVVKRSEGYTVEYAEFAPLGQIRLISAVSLQGYEGVAVVRVSPIWQFLNIPKARGSSPPALRPALVSKPESLHAVGARHAFRKLQVAWLKKRAQHLGVDLLVGASLLQILLQLCISILQCAREAALVLAAQRISTTYIDNAFASELLGVGLSPRRPAPSRLSPGRGACVLAGVLLCSPWPPSQPARVTAHHLCGNVRMCGRRFALVMCHVLCVHSLAHVVHRFWPCASLCWFRQSSPLLRTFSASYIACAAVPLVSAPPCTCWPASVLC